MNFSFSEDKVYFLISLDDSWLKFILLPITMDTSALGFVYLDNLFPAHCSEVMSTFVSEMCFFYEQYSHFHDPFLIELFVLLRLSLLSFLSIPDMNPPTPV